MTATISTEQKSSKPLLLTLLPWASLTNWSVHFALENNFSYNPYYSLRPIGSFLLRSRNEIIVQDDTTYQRLTVRWYSQGIVLRDTAKGQAIGTKRQFQVKTGQFVLSRIDARFGALGMIPLEFDGAIITNDFPAYDLDLSIVNPQFFVLVISTAAFMRFCQNCSMGTTNRQRLDEDLFLNVSIPIPSLAEQARLVVEYEQQIQEAEQLRAEAERFEKSIKTAVMQRLKMSIQSPEINMPWQWRFVESTNLTRWDAFTATTFSTSFPTHKVGTLITNIATGTTPPTEREDYFNGSIPFYAPNDLNGEIYLSGSSRQLSQVALEEGKVRIFPKDTLLFVGIGSTIGKVGILPDEASANQQVTGLTFDVSKILPAYAFVFFNLFKEITTQDKAQSTIPILNQSRITNINFPVPPLKIQREIVNDYMQASTTKANLLTHAATLEAAAKATFEAAIFA